MTIRERLELAQRCANRYRLQAHWFILRTHNLQHLRKFDTATTSHCPLEVNALVTASTPTVLMKAHRKTSRKLTATLCSTIDSLTTQHVNRSASCKRGPFRSLITVRVTLSTAQALALTRISARAF